MKTISVLLVFSFICLGLLGCGMTNPITMEKYNKVSTDMTLAQVDVIAGIKGQEMSSTTMPAVPGVMGALTSQVYSWANPDGSNMTIMFQNGKVISKAQLGLK